MRIVVGPHHLRVIEGDTLTVYVGLIEVDRPEVDEQSRDGSIPVPIVYTMERTFTEDRPVTLTAADFGVEEESEEWRRINDVIHGEYLLPYFTRRTLRADLVPISPFEEDYVRRELRHYVEGFTEGYSLAESDAHSVRFSKMNAEAEAEMAAWEEELRGRKKR